MTARRVLIVDDDNAIRQIAGVSMAAVGGHLVSMASSGTEGIDRAIADLPDAVLLDVMMPGLDGPGTAERLHADARTSGIAIILLTAKVQPSEVARFMGMPGIMGVIAKPFDPMELPGQVARILGWDGA